jgi:ribonuclease VapC
MSSCVLDASAVLAVALKESGMEKAMARMSGALLSTVNLQEVFERLAEENHSTAHTVAHLKRMGVVIVDYTTRHAELAAAMKPVCKPNDISLADRACLALAKAEGLTALTGDRNWAAVDHGVTVELIR